MYLKVKGLEKKSRAVKENVLSVLSLFTSTATLFCCALPAAVAAVAGGAAVGTLVSSLPWLVPLSRHKEWLFLVAGLLIVFNGILTLRPQGKVACAVTGGRGCESAGRFRKAMFWSSTLIYVAGAFFAYAIVPLMRMVEG